MIHSLDLNVYAKLLLTIAVVISFIFIFLIYRLMKLKINVQFLVANNTELTAQSHNEHLEKINNLKTIEQLMSKVEYLQQILSETEKARSEAMSSAKAVLFDLGGELSKQLIEIHKKENKEARELSEKNINEVGAKFHNEFERLIQMIGSLSKDVEQSRGTVDIIKQSLLSPSGAGKLAEITLENILKASGLRAMLDFAMQYSFASAENNKLRPDALIFLPANNLMIVDAKASKFLMEDVDGTNLSRTMNTHLKSLSSKEYATNILTSLKKQGEDYGNIITLMFLPTEHAIEKIIDADANFLEKSWSLNIFPVGPTGLMNMLSFAKFQISEYRQRENHQLILQEVQQLLQSISLLTEYSQKLGSNIQSMVNNYDKFAASFNRNFLSKAKNIQKLGVTVVNKNFNQTLERYQLISNKSELIEVEIVNDIKQIEKA